jgi:hypothetical protein
VIYRFLDAITVVSEEWKKMFGENCGAKEHCSAGKNSSKLQSYRSVPSHNTASSIDRVWKM